MFRYMTRFVLAATCFFGGLVGTVVFSFDPGISTRWVVALAIEALGGIAMFCQVFG